MAEQNKYRNILVKNTSQKLVIVRVSTQKSNITQSAYSQAFEAATACASRSSSSKSSDTSVGGGYGGVSVSASHAQSQSASNSNSNSNKQSSSVSWKKAYSPFISDGFVQVKPGKQRKTAIQGNLAYISVATVEGEPVYIDNWSTIGNEFNFVGDDLEEVEEVEKKEKPKVKPKQQVEAGVIGPYKQNMKILLFVSIIITIFKFITVYISINQPSIMIETSNQSNKQSIHPLIFTITNKGFSEFTHNWILNLQHLGMNDFCVICTDKECKEDLLHWNKQINEEQIIVYDLKLTSTTFLNYTNPLYRQFVKKRAQIIQYFYEEHFPKFVENAEYKFDGMLYLDSDMGITQDFTNSLYQNGYYEFDITVQADINKKNCKNLNATHLKQLNICSCFILLRFHKSKDSIIKDFLKEWDNAITRPDEGDQPGFNRALRVNKDKLDIGIVDCGEYPSGWLLQNAQWVKDNYWDENDHSVKIIHANWMIGSDAKKHFLQMHKQWYSPFPNPQNSTTS